MSENIFMKKDYNVFDKKNSVYLVLFFFFSFFFFSFYF